MNDENAGKLGTVNREMAKGAGWMVAMRLAIRAIGLVSTLILARLLVPEDFGLVALAVMIFGLIESFGELGLDVVLIHNQKAGRDYYDTAWTLSIFRGVATGAVLVAIAGSAANFFNDQRLTHIIYVLAVVSVISGFVNIGTVNFRKEMNFGMDFEFLVSNKVIAFVITISLAFWLRSYWALVLGIAGGATAKTILSYVMHSYRPRISLARWREIIHFSKWLLVNSLVSFVSKRSDTMIIGKIAGASSLGIYSIAFEIATLATTELIMPICRALLPGYAKLGDDTEALQKSFIGGFGLIVMLGAPIAAGIGLVAEPLVLIFLGEKWAEVIVPLQILALFALIQMSNSNSYAILFAIGRPRQVTAITGISAVVSIPACIWATTHWGIAGTAWGLVAASVVAVMTSFILICRLFNITIWELLSPLWRTVASLAIMIVAVEFTRGLVAAGLGSDAHLAILVAQVLVGTLSYIGIHLLTWMMAGYPEGSEKALLSVVPKHG